MGRWKRSLGAAVVLGALVASGARAALRELDDPALGTVTGQGLVGFSVTNDPTRGDVARIDFRMDLATYTDLVAFQAGYYDDGVGGLGWDQDWRSVTVGTAAQESVVRGFYVEAVFSNVNDPATRALQSVAIGTGNLTGDLAATFASFSGDVKVDGVALEGHRIVPDFSQVRFASTDFRLSVTLQGPQKGIWVHWGDATKVQ